MSGQSFVGRILFFDGSFNAWLPGGTEHRGDGKQHQKNKRRVNRNQQANGDHQPQDPSCCRRQRHIHMVEYKDLVTLNRKPTQEFGTLVVLDRRHLRMQSGHVGFQRNSDLVANSRWVRSLMTLRNHVAAAVMANPPAAIKTSSLSLSRKPLARNMSQTAINASGNAASNDNKNATDNYQGSAINARFRARHIDLGEIDGFTP